MPSEAAFAVFCPSCMMEVAEGLDTNVLGDMMERNPNEPPHDFSPFLPYSFVWNSTCLFCPYTLLYIASHHVHRREENNRLDGPLV